METHFQHQFLMNIWCRIIGNNMVAPFVIEHCVTAMYLSFIQKTVPLLHTGLRLWLQHGGAPRHVGWHWTEYFNLHCLLVTFATLVLGPSLQGDQVSHPFMSCGTPERHGLQHKCRHENRCRELWNYHKAITSLFTYVFLLWCYLTHSFLLLSYIQQGKT